MNGPQAPDCTIFIDAEMGDHPLLSLITEVLFPPGSPPSPLEVVLIRNEDYDAKRRRLFPDGFVHFRYMLDLYLDESDIPRVARLLNALWDEGIPAVAACAFEDQLPERGGYRSRNIPWPV